MKAYFCNVNIGRKFENGIFIQHNVLFHTEIIKYTQNVMFISQIIEFPGFYYNRVVFYVFCSYFITDLNTYIYIFQYYGNLNLLIIAKDLDVQRVLTCSVILYDKFCNEISKFKIILAIRNFVLLKEYLNVSNPDIIDNMLI
jgi:hypothetical protein